MSAEPLSREERGILESDRADCPEYEMCVECAQEARWEATVQSVEALAEHRLKALDGMHADLLAVEAERDALARRVEALERAVSGAHLWCPDDQDVLCFVAESGDHSIIILESCDDFTDFGHVRRTVDALNAALAADDEAAGR